MIVKKQPCGEPRTNCYVITINEKNLIIDPGIGATDFVLENITNPVAILITHGHFDHVYSVAQLKEELEVPVYMPKEDKILLDTNEFGVKIRDFKVDFEVEGDATFNIDGIEVKYELYRGHTPGCSTITIDNTIFSGDFIFKDGVGRSDFEFSNQQDMKESLNKFLKRNENKDKKIYPGHGFSTTIFNEIENIKKWRDFL